MIAGLPDPLRRLARAAPSAFRDDPVFRYAAIGALAALVLHPGRLSGAPTNPPKPPALRAPATLASAYGDGASAPLATQSIAPGRALNGLTERPDPHGEPDDFGTLRSPPPPARSAAE